MRRLSLLLFLSAVLPAVPAAAQNSGLATGLIAGINVSTFGGADVSGLDVNARTGLLAGIFGMVDLTSNLGLEVDVMFAQKGADFTTPAGELAAIKTDYLQIPALLVGRFQVAGNAEPYVLAGPSLGFELGCEAAQATGTNTSQIIDCDELSGSADRAGTDFGLVFGGGVRLGNVLLSLRYDLGLTQLKFATGATDVKNRALTLTAGLGFRVRR